MPQDPRAPPRRPRRAAAAACAVVLVVLLHGGLLATLPPPAGRGGGPAPARPLQWRQIVAPTRVAAGDPSPPRSAAAPAPAARQAGAGRPLAAPAAPAAAESEPPAWPAAGGEPPPVYATRLPPPATLQYLVQRGGSASAGGVAELRWRPDAAGYVLTWGQASSGSASVGAIDAHGIAPERQVDTRRGREVRAVNFQRDAARITFSGPTTEFPLLPGSQDRLSWMLQVAAVLAAEPALGEAGQELALFVAGARGDAAVWTFSSSGHENAELPAGRVADTVHLHREPQRPYDARVDVWLDPARHHLPVRLRLQYGAGGETADYLLQSLSLP